MAKGFLNTLRLFFFPTSQEVEKTYNALGPIIDTTLEKTKLNKYPAVAKVVNPSTAIYFLVGCFTTFVNLGVYYLLYFVCGMPSDESFLIQIINSLAWLIAVVACFLPNKFYVFRSKYIGFSPLAKEFFSFMLSRLATLVIEEIGLFIFCTTLHWSNLIVKPLLAVVVIILNYVFAKLWVFTKKTVK